MDKAILLQYKDAETLVEHTERQIQCLKRAKETVLSDTVKGSNQNFPYEPVTFKVEGFGSAAYSDAEIKKLEAVLAERRRIAADLRLRVEAWVNTLPFRIQLIVQMRYLGGATWEEVSRKIGKNTTAESVRKEYERFMAGADRTICEK